MSVLGRRTLLGLALAGVALAAMAPAAHAASSPVDLQVVDRETGQTLKVWRHDGRLWVAGEKGHRYGLRVTNHTGQRVEVVMSVDGVDIRSGETAGFAQRGYIFGPYETYDLNGWRKSLEEVADFTFTRGHKSYAALTGRPDNIGVIGIALFYERPQPVAVARPAPPELPTPRRYVEPSYDYDQSASSGSSVGEVVVTAEKREQNMQSAPPAISAYSGKAGDTAPSQRASIDAPAPKVEEQLGTGHGQREHDVMTIVSFDRATTQPAFTQEIAYDSRANLIAMGVIPTWRGDDHQPHAFPASPEYGGPFVPDPPGER